MTEPEDPGASADAAPARGDSEAALSLWDDQRRRFPDCPAAYLRAADLLERTGRAAAAEAIVESGVAQCPGDLTLALHYVRLAIERGDTGAAQLRWEAARERFAADDTILAVTTNAFLAEGRRAEAERFLAETARRFPDVPGPLLAHARLAQERAEWGGGARAMGHGACPLSGPGGRCGERGDRAAPPRPIGRGGRFVA